MTCMKRFRKGDKISVALFLIEGDTSSMRMPHIHDMMNPVYLVPDQ